jgi:hypothetical protein
MSTELALIGDMRVVRMYDGRLGTVVVIGSNSGKAAVVLTASDVYELIVVLTEHLQWMAERKAKEYEEKIKKYREMQDTVFQEAAECERFIRDLRLLELPLALLGLHRLKEEAKHEHE